MKTTLQHQNLDNRLALKECFKVTAKLNLLNIYPAEFIKLFI